MFSEMLLADHLSMLLENQARCHEVEKRTINALAELGFAADVEKVSDIRRIMDFNILGTPGLVIDGKIVCSGKIPRLEEIKAWIREASK